VHSSVYCLPADLLGEGADRVVRTVRDCAGVSGVTIAACYHATRDSWNAMKPRIQRVLTPWNPGFTTSDRRPAADQAA
jgi:hypothetical protein